MPVTTSTSPASQRTDASSKLSARRLVIVCWRKSLRKKNMMNKKLIQDLFIFGSCILTTGFAAADRSRELGLSSWPDQNILDAYIVQDGKRSDEHDPIVSKGLLSD
ncbi:hypothetical protein KSP40_PGU000502 [Platanthera guangdongensis]|uniref:Uncharacterized protein n=1 Tax=Platanthera guangdongensis TaxID=2320717 RepID=A0ABR2M9F2_9ASPA